MRFTNYLSVAVLVVVGSVAPVLAETRPHKLSGTGQFTSAEGDFAGQGRATHLGSFTETGNVALIPTADPAVFRLEGWAIHTAANGDEVHELLVGELNALTGVTTATATYVGGTGRFVDASGSSVISVQLLPDGSYTFEGEGTIDY